MLQLRGWFPSNLSKNTVESLSAASNQRSNFATEDEAHENNDCAEKVDAIIVPTRLLEVTFANKKDHRFHDEYYSSKSKK